MKTPFLQILLAAFVLATACKTDAVATEGLDESGAVDSTRDTAIQALPSEVAAMYRAHTDAMPAGKALSYDLLLHFGGTERFRGSVIQTPSMDRIAMTRSDGAELRWDGSQVGLMVSDTSVKWPGARFAAFTWPYFFAAPMKMADPGTKWTAAQPYPWVDGQAAPGSKLTFAPGTGDAPDDYYIVFPNAEGRVDGMAYVVTAGKGDDVDVSTLEPHAIRYSDYTMVDGVPIAHHWSFHDWNAETGLGADTIGYADLNRIEWVEAKPEFFATEGGEVVE